MQNTVPESAKSACGSGEAAAHAHRSARTGSGALVAASTGKMPVVPVAGGTPATPTSGPRYDG
jgi:hypothetical protein